MNEAQQIAAQFYNFSAQNKELVIGIKDILIFNRHFDFFVMLILINAFFFIYRFIEASLIMSVVFCFFIATQLSTILHNSKSVAFDFILSGDLSINKTVDDKTELKEISAFVGTLYYVFRYFWDSIFYSLENKDLGCCILIIFWLIMLFHLFWSIDGFTLVVFLTNAILIGSMIYHILT